MVLTVLIYFVFLLLLAFAAVQDAQTMRIPNTIVLALLALWIGWRTGLTAGSMMVGIDFVTAVMAPSPFKEVSLASCILGAIFLGGGLLVVTALFEMRTGRWGMGGGDIKLMAIVGLFLGLERGIVCLFVACIVSVFLALIWPHTRWATTDIVESGHLPLFQRGIPFGPAIAIGAVAALFVS